MRDAAAVKCEALSVEALSRQVSPPRGTRGRAAVTRSSPGSVAAAQECLGRRLLPGKNCAYLFDLISAAGPLAPTWCSSRYAAQIHWYGGSSSELIWGKEAACVYFARGCKICAAGMLISTWRSRDGTIWMSVPGRWMGVKQQQQQHQETRKPATSAY